MNRETYLGKKVLLIGGGGTLGSYTAYELLKNGATVDVLCLEDRVSTDEKLRFHKGFATYETIAQLLEESKYNGVVNFIHYPDVEQYKPIHMLLAANTEHVIFLSSYRIYADSSKPITEDTITLLDTSRDEAFLEDKTYYALAKAVCERYIKNESGTKNWTIVRPVISFSSRRFDLVTRSGTEILDCIHSNTPVLLPEASKKLTAGLDWAGNTGKIIANLMLNQEAYGEAYTVSSAQNLTWEEVADLYSQLTGANIHWIPTEEYEALFQRNDPYILKYDRLFNRVIDNSKVLNVTGLRIEDFTSIRDGLAVELKNAGFMQTPKDNPEASLISSASAREGI